MTRKRRPPDPSEHAIQASFFEWWQMSYKSPLAFAVPNAGKRSYAVAARMKKEGLRPGVPDVFVAIPAWGGHGLWLEFKSRTGRVSEDQASMMSSLMDAGYRVAVVRSLEEAIEVVKVYLGDPRATRPDFH